MSTVYTNIKNKKLTVETSNTKFPYATNNKESGGEVVAKFESTNLLQVCSVCNLVSFKHLLLVAIMLSIYQLLITPLVSFKHLLLVAMVLLIYPLHITALLFFKNVLLD